MTNELIRKSRSRHAFVDIALLITTLALVVSLAIAATVVSIGMARADTLGTLTASNGGRLAVAIAVGIALAALGGFTAAMVRDGQQPRD